ncbi:MAG: hypothetical protein JJE39_02615 [Vicinamibacteria bacterium]|nr:hypothetical protein [Vicinamibacteria bacterium]
MTLRSHAGAAGLYAVLTALMTWPLVSRLNLIEAGDSAYFAWAIAWTNHAVLNDPLNLPHANALYPLRYALFLDEPIVATSLLALPLRLVTVDPIVTLNLIRLLTFFLSALGVRALGLSVGLSSLAAFAAGALFSFSSNRVSSPAHLSVLGTQFLPLYFLFLHRWARDGSARAAGLAGLFFGLSAWACGYHALLAAAILPIPILVLLERRVFLRTAPVGLVVALSFLLPLRWLHHQALQPLQYARSVSETASFSAAIESLFSTSAANRIWGSLTENLRTVVEADLFQGLTVLFLTGLALLALRRTPGACRVTLGYLTLVICAFLVALGPEVRLFGATLFSGPFTLLREFELFRMIRVPARASVFMGLGFAMLAGLGLDRLRNLRLRYALAGLALLEATAAPLNVVAADRCLDAADKTPPIYVWLKEKAPGGPLIELPILPNDGRFQRPRFDDSVYLLRSTTHWRPLVNGFAGTEPPSYVELRGVMEDFPSPESIELLRSMKVRLILLHLRAYGPNRRQALLTRLSEFPSQLLETAHIEDDLALQIVDGPGATGSVAVQPSPSEERAWAAERPGRSEASSPPPSRSR